MALLDPTPDQVKRRQIDRLNVILKMCEWTGTELARAAGLAPSTINRVLNNSAINALSATTVAKIEAAARARAKSLHGNDFRVIQNDEPGLAPEEAITALALMSCVPEVDIQASAGGGSGGIIDKKTPPKGYYGFPKAGFQTLTGAPESGATIIEVIGDSMAPTLLPGQRVMVNIEDQTPSPPGIFVLWDGLGFVVKRLEFVAFSEPPRVKVMSDNPRYGAYERIIDEAYIQGRVVGVWART